MLTHDFRLRHSPRWTMHGDIISKTTIARKLQRLVNEMLLEYECSGLVHPWVVCQDDVCIAKEDLIHTHAFTSQQAEGYACSLHKPNGVRRCSGFRDNRIKASSSPLRSLYIHPLLASRITSLAERPGLGRLHSLFRKTVFEMGFRTNSIANRSHRWCNV